MRMKPTKGQRWRVSVYPPGVDANVPTQYPLIHKASREQATAEAHFASFARQIGGGNIGRVICHQGKLYSGHSQYIHNDTRWWPRERFIVSNIAVSNGRRPLAPQPVGQSGNGLEK